LINVGCASSPITTVTGGAPNSPSASTFQPWRASTACLAAASELKFAIVAPVVNAPAQLASRPKMSRIQPSAIASSAAAAGVGDSYAAF
jgi:hypothetical protein